MAVQPTKTVIQQIMSHVLVDDGCWEWVGSTLPSGYGQFRAQGKHHYAHRASYELFVGPIPSGMTLDHLCHTEDVECFAGTSCPHRRCVNPSHLEPVTTQVNIARGRGLGGRTVRTHCPNGHELSGHNLIHPQRCRACKQAYERAYHATHRTQRNERMRVYYAKKTKG